MTTVTRSEEQLNVIFLFPRIFCHCHAELVLLRHLAKCFRFDYSLSFQKGSLTENLAKLKFFIQKNLEDTESYQLQSCSAVVYCGLWTSCEGQPNGKETLDVDQWNEKCSICSVPSSRCHLFIFLVWICASGLCCASMSFVHLLLLLLRLLLLVIWPTSGQFFDVPVQLLGDDVMPVNNSTVPLCWTCGTPTVLAQQAAYFRGSTKLFLPPCSSIHWKLPRFTILVSITSLKLFSCQPLFCAVCCISTYLICRCEVQKGVSFFPPSFTSFTRTASSLVIHCD